LTDENRLGQSKCSDLHVQFIMLEITTKFLGFNSREHLCNSSDFYATLRTIRWKRSLSDSSKNARADNLYLEILLACDWDDQAFAKGYILVVGAIIAAKTTLMMSALKSLYHYDLSMPVDIKYLAPLITGVMNDNTPVKLCIPL
jgi:hypothetical protein